MLYLAMTFIKSFANIYLKNIDVIELPMLPSKFVLYPNRIQAFPKHSMIWIRFQNMKLVLQT